MVYLFFIILGLYSCNFSPYFILNVYVGDSASQNGAVTQYCRLCSETIPSDPIFLFGEAEEENEETVKLFEKVNSSLPIHVSQIVLRII